MRLPKHDTSSKEGSFYPFLGKTYVGKKGHTTVGGSEIRQAPGEVGSLSRYLQRLINPR